MKIVLPGLIVFALWSLFCVRWYVCGIHELCGDQPNGSEETVEKLPEESESRSNTAEVIEAPLTFEWSGATPLVGTTFEGYKDSLNALFENDPAYVVEIIGLYDPQELNNSTFDNLGLARAQAVKDLLLSSGVKRSINIASKPEDLSSGLGGHIQEGVLFNLNPSIPANGFLINRSGQKLTIHFPTNSGSPQTDQEVLNALMSLAKDAKEQNRVILVVGHTDNQGDVQKNKVLGLVRATKIKEVLVNAGMPEEKVLAESEGEDAPMANNETTEGRQLNRRVELAII